MSTIAVQRTRMGFRSELRRLRESVGLSAAALDREIGRTNYVSRIESDGRGSLPLPSFDTVLQLGEELRRLGADTSGERLWAVAEPEIMPPELLAHYRRERIDEPLPEGRRRLIAALEALGVADQVVGRLGDAVRGWADETAHRTELPPGAAHPATLPPTTLLGLALVEFGARLLHPRAFVSPALVEREANLTEGLGGLATAITLVATQGERNRTDLDVLGRLVGQVMPDRIRQRLEQLEQTASHVHELGQRVAYLDQRRAELEELVGNQATELERQDHAIAALERRVPR